MIPQKLTLKDISKALQLSESTISRALKDSYSISEATRKLVQDYAKEHNYHPNLLAQGLKNKNSRCIGVVLCNIPNSFYAEVLSGIESVAYQKDYFVFLTQSQESREREVKNVNNLTFRSVDGLLVSLSAESQDVSHFTQLHEQGLPMVFFDRTTDEINTHTVTADNLGGAREATEHLLSNGYRKIAHITSSGHLSITRERLNGYESALLKNSITPVNEYVKYCAHGGMLYDEIEKAVTELLQLPNPPDAILAASDRITTGCLSSLLKKGIKVPEEMGLIGFSNFSSPELFTPSLSTIKQPAFEIGKKAAELLIQLIESKKKPEYQKVVLPTEVTVRRSSQKM